MKSKKSARASSTENGGTQEKLRGREPTMKRLKQAGLEVFSEAGLDGATTKMIASRSGVNESLIIRYFQSKAGLLTAIVMDQVREHSSDSPKHPLGKTAAEEIENFLIFQLHQSIENLNFLRLSISTIAIDSAVRAELGKFIDASFQPDQSSLAVRLRELQKMGKIRRNAAVDRISLLVFVQLSGIRLALVAMPALDLEELESDIRFFANEIARGIAS